MPPESLRSVGALSDQVRFRKDRDTSPMGDEVAETAGRWLAALERGDPAPEMCDPDVVITNWAESPIPGPYVGLDGVRRWWNDMTEVVDNGRFKICEIEQIDDRRALSTQRLIGTFRASGIEFDFLWGSVISVRDGKILSATGYISPEAAREAAGLE